MDENYLTVNYPNGCIRLVRDKFFPAKVRAFRALLQTVALSDDDEAVLAQIRQYLHQGQESNRSQWRPAAKAYLDSKQELHDLSRMQDSGRHPNGVPLKADELEALGPQVSLAAMRVKKILAACKKHSAIHDRYDRNLRALDVFMEKGGYR